MSGEGLTKERREKLVAKIRQEAARLTIAAGEPGARSRQDAEKLLEQADSLEESADMIEREE